MNDPTPTDTNIFNAVYRYVIARTDFNTPTGDLQYTAAHTAVAYQNFRIFKLLAEAGADLDAKNIDGATCDDLVARATDLESYEEFVRNYAAFRNMKSLQNKAATSKPNKGL